MGDDTTTINLLKGNMVYETTLKENSPNQTHLGIQESTKLPKDEPLLISPEPHKLIDFTESISYELPSFTAPKIITKLQISIIVGCLMILNIVYPFVADILNEPVLIDQLFKDLLDLTKSCFWGLFVASIALFTSQHVHRTLNHVLSHNFKYITAASSLFFFSALLSKIQMKISDDSTWYFVKQIYKLRKKNYHIGTFNSIFILILIAKIFIDFIFFLEFQNFYAPKIRKINKLRFCIYVLNRKKFVKKRDFINNAFKEFKSIISNSTEYSLKGQIPDKLILFAEKNQERNFQAFLNKIISEIQEFPICLEEFKNRYIYIQLPLGLIVAYVIFSYLKVSGKKAEEESILNTAILFSFTPIFYTVFKKEFVPLFYSYLFCFQQRRFDVSDTVFINGKMHRCLAITPFTSEFISEGKNLIICNSEYINNPYSILNENQAIYELEWNYTFSYMKAFNKISYLKDSIRKFINEHNAFFFNDFEVDFIKEEGQKSKLFVKFKVVDFIDVYTYEKTLKIFRFFLEDEFRRLEFY